MREQRGYGSRALRSASSRLEVGLDTSMRLMEYA